MNIPDYSPLFSPDIPTDRQLDNVRHLVATHEPLVTAWLLCHPLVVDRLCDSLGLRRGTVTAGVRAIVAHVKKNALPT